MPTQLKVIRRPGLSLIEFVVIFAIVSLVLIVLLMAAARGREEARLVSCRMNLGRIGLALAAYDQNFRSLPVVTELVPLDAKATNGAPSAGPLRTLLETFQLPDLTEFRDPKTASLGATRTGTWRDGRSRFCVFKRSQRDGRLVLSSDQLSSGHRRLAVG